MEQKDFESKKLKTKNSEINVEKACKVVEQRSFKTCWMSKNKVVNLWMDLIVCSETFMLTLHKNFAALMFLPSTICNFEKSNFHCINATFIKNMQWGSFDPRSTPMSQTSKTNKVFIPPINHSSLLFVKGVWTQMTSSTSPVSASLLLLLLFFPIPLWFQGSSDSLRSTLVQQIQNVAMVFAIAVQAKHNSASLLRKRTSWNPSAPSAA